MWFNILGFWVVGFTSGWALTFKAGLGLSGIWIGIVSGVTTTGMPSAIAHSCHANVEGHGHPPRPVKHVLMTTVFLLTCLQHLVHLHAAA